MDWESRKRSRANAATMPLTSSLFIPRSTAAAVAAAMKPLLRYLPAAVRRIVAVRRRGLYGFFYDHCPVRSSNR